MILPYVVDRCLARDARICGDPVADEVTGVYWAPFLKLVTNVAKVAFEAKPELVANPMRQNLPSFNQPAVPSTLTTDSSLLPTPSSLARFSSFLPTPFP